MDQELHGVSTAAHKGVHAGTDGAACAVLHAAGAFPSAGAFHASLLKCYGSIATSTVGIVLGCCHDVRMWGWLETVLHCPACHRRLTAMQACTTGSHPLRSSCDPCVCVCVQTSVVSLGNTKQPLPGFMSRGSLLSARHGELKDNVELAMGMPEVRLTPLGWHHSRGKAAWQGPEGRVFKQAGGHFSPPKE